MNIYKSVTELVGRTPLLEVGNIEKEAGLKARVLVKLEYFNPAGSVKDRVALSMIEDAEQSGRIQKGATIIEPTSGNTGIGLASIAAAKGYKAIFVMPETMSVERRKLLLGYGAKIVLTEGAKGMKGAIEKAAELEKEIGNAIVLGQFENKANPAAHYRTTGDLGGHGWRCRYFHSGRRDRRYSHRKRTISEGEKTFCEGDRCGAGKIPGTLRRTARSSRSSGHWRRVHP